MTEKRYFVVSNNSKNSTILQSKLIDYLSDWRLDAVNPEFVFILGGDGTFLRNVIKFNKIGCKLVAINTGRFGFYAQFSKNNLSTILQIVNDTKNFQKVNLLHASWNHDEALAINDIALSSTVARETDVFVNGIFLEHCWNSGFLFSTTTGSTAFSRSANGAIIYPQINCFQFLEFSPIITNNFLSIRNPIIFPNDAFVTLQKKRSKDCIYSLTIDGVDYASDFYLESLTVSCVLSQAEIYFCKNTNQHTEKLFRHFVKS